LAESVLVIPVSARSDLLCSRVGAENQGNSGSRSCRHNV